LPNAPLAWSAFTLEAENAPMEVRPQGEEIQYLKNNNHIKAERVGKVRIN
jgi:hypothetical protein